MKNQSTEIFGRSQTLKRKDPSNSQKHNASTSVLIKKANSKTFIQTHPRKLDGALKT
jgi:hypothetical protein